MTNQKTIIIDDAVPYAKEIFSHLGNVITLPGREITQKDLISAHALIVRSRTQVNASLLNGTSVEYVGSTVVGLDHVDQQYLHDNNITFYSAQGCNANSVAEFIINALFELAEAFNFELTDKTIGILGVGNVGSRVYEKASKLNIKCLLNDPPKQAAQPNQTDSLEYVSLEETLKADIITVHTPLTKTGKYSTYNLIGEEQLSNIRANQIIINAARGGIINEKAWLHTQTLADIIDCWENEPNIDEALYQKAWLATPHIAGHSLDAKIAGSTMVYHSLCNFWGQSPQTDWQQQLPAAPETLKFNTSIGKQAALRDLFKNAHDIFSDDAGIRDKNIDIVHKKYENYRRNYPIYREWHQHKINITNSKGIGKLLNSLGFKQS